MNHDSYSSEINSRMHSRLVLAPLLRVLWCSPGHALQSPLAYSSWKRPRGHVAQGSNPLAEKVPGRHWAAGAKWKHLQEDNPSMFALQRAGL